MTMTLKDFVIDHLEYTFERETWQPPLGEAVAGLTAAQAAWKPAPARHSIWQIVRHVTLWKQAVLDGLAGRPADADALERMDWQEVAGDDTAWQHDVARLHKVARRLKETALAADEAALLAAVPTVQDAPTQPLTQRLLRQATHDIYHAGQIRYLRALQGV
ncbi:MAG TPA: DinB family protein [bacterium]|jgi:hypothetical protein|nr:DinB family protein [bacterium]